MSRKGFANIVLMLAIAVSVLATSMFGRYILPNTGNQKIVRSSTIKSEPIIVKGADGKTYYLQKTETIINDSTEEKQLTFWQRLLVLPKLWLLLMVLGIFSPAVAGYMKIINSRLLNSAGQIVKGVENGLNKVDTLTQEKIKTELSKVYDNSTKDLVRTLKK